MRRVSAIALAAGALAFGSGAAAQVTITGSETMLKNGSSYQGSLGDLPAPPPSAAPNAAAPKAGGPGTYSNTFTCIPDSAGAMPAPGGHRGTAKIGQFAIHGNSPPPDRVRAIRPPR